MGVLEDAIRDHLELKRRHGAEEEEVRRQELEALGPVRRDVEPSDEGELGAEEELALDEEELASDEAAEPLEHPDDRRAESETRLLEPEELGVHEPAWPERVEPDELRDEEPLPEEEPLADEEESSFAEPPAHDEPFREEPASGEHLGEEHLHDEPRHDEPTESGPREAGASEEHPLEDDLEFGEDTPEQDRPGPERRPPRDFDFE